MLQFTHEDWQIGLHSQGPCRGSVINGGLVQYNRCLQPLLHNNPDCHINQPLFCCWVQGDVGYSLWSWLGGKTGLTNTDGLKQGCWWSKFHQTAIYMSFIAWLPLPITDILYHCSIWYVEKKLSKSLIEWKNKGIKSVSEYLSNLQFADDTAPLSKTSGNLKTSRN